MKLIRLIRVLIAIAARPIPMIGTRPSSVVFLLVPSPTGPVVAAVSPLIVRGRGGLLWLPVVMCGAIRLGVVTALWLAALRVMVVAHNLCAVHW